ncbi:MAG: hypothetical protein QHH80_09110 [Anaerolineae bacterium]|nr:hypothetical protein [Anaerolineae bacterium]
MSKRLYPVVALLVAAVLLVACGGGGGAGKPPVAMQKYETSTFAMEYPSAWEKSSLEMMGISMAFFSPQKIDTTDPNNLDLSTLGSDYPIVVVMTAPQSVAGAMGMDDIDAAMSDMDITREPDVKVIKQGDTTMGGAKGKIFVGTGTDPDIGKMGAHVVMAKRDDGTVLVFMGATPDKDMDKNMKIFEYMQAAFKFK